MVDPLTTFVAALLNRISFKLDFKYERKRIELVTRWETDSFQICTPIREKIWKKVIIPKRRYLHRTDDDKWDWIDI